ncbi:PAS domain-containing sensor histidine kinase [Allomuricauda sp. CAU 1633]|uniref:PAS domain-containing sensor histidine kinase n=1 Tax=Allomuricauda sp. CAU 1633 TaxID=2816036 RepID=UPI001F5D0B36|nr:PAS domain-containing sensor histidine kinase [Muricauda sp. CAU 1633]
MKAVERIAQHYLLKQLPTATALVGVDGILIDASDSWLHTFGLCPKDALGVSVYRLFKNYNADCGKSLKQCLGKSTTHTCKFSKREGSSVSWYENTFTPWYDEKENLIGSIIQTHNITEEILKEKELDRMIKLLKTKSEVAKVGYWEFDLITEELFWCEETKKIHEVPPSYIPNTNEAIEFFKQGYDRNRISMLFHQALSQKAPYSEKVVIITPNGKEKWVKAMGKPIVENGVVVKMFGTLQDIHDQVLVEMQTKENQQLLTTLIDNIPLNIFIKDIDSKKILVNKAECEYLEKSPEELIGKTDFDLYDEEIAKISREEDLEVMRSLKPMIGKETMSIRKDGETTYFLTSKIPLLDLDGKVNGLIGISMDISGLKKKEDQLRDLINVTSLQNKKLINFAHIVSHNLRSHSANFSMLLEFLAKEEDEAEKERIVSMLSNASDNLMETLEDLNQIIDINTNVNLEKEALNLHQNINRVQNNLSAFLGKHQAEIQNNVPKNLEVQSVPAYLDSIILNLMTNAAKYKSPDRKPIIRINASKHEKTTIFSFSDNGLGIDLEKYGGKIFGMYKTFHNNKEARGLGLYVIKNQIEAMGGSITVSSEVDKGTTFNVYFNEEDQ